MYLPKNLKTSKCLSFSHDSGGCNSKNQYASYISIMPQCNVLGKPQESKVVIDMLHGILTLSYGGYLMYRTIGGRQNCCTSYISLHVKAMLNICSVPLNNLIKLDLDHLIIM